MQVIINASFGGAVANAPPTNDEYALPFTPDLTIADIKSALASTAGLPRDVLKHMTLVDNSPLTLIEGKPSLARATRKRSKEVASSGDDECVLSFIDFQHYSDGSGKVIRPKGMGSTPWLDAEYVSIVVMVSDDGSLRLFREEDAPSMCRNESTCAALHWHDGRRISAKVEGTGGLGAFVVNGHVFNELGRDASIAELQGACANRFGIPVEHQALLCVGDANRRTLRLDDCGGEQQTFYDLHRSLMSMGNVGALRLCDLRKPTEASEAAASTVRSWMRTLIVHFSCDYGCTAHPVAVSREQSVFEAFKPIMDRFGFDTHDGRIIFDGNRLTPWQTFGELEAESGDQFDWYRDMMGGMFSVTSGRLGYADLTSVTAPIRLKTVDGAALGAVKATATTTLRELKVMAAAALDAMGAVEENADVDAMDEAEVRALAKSLQLAAKAKRAAAGH